MSDDIVIRIDGLWKRYGLPLPAAYYRGRQWLRSRRDGRSSESAGGSSGRGPWALRDINLEVNRGETLGIIGRNGAGKSTLLKVLAGVTPPTRGQVEVLGRVFPMIELNAGLHPELTGRENVRLLGAIMGILRQEIEAAIPEIEEFCELGEWFDKPVRMYSSGMLARLGFGVAMNVDADVLLVDEVLAVGDIAFQRKCLDRMEQLQHSRATMILVSHSVRQVERLCNRTLLLDEGHPVALGETDEVASRYYEQSNKRILEQRAASGKKHLVVQSHMENALVDIVGMRLLNGAGEQCETFSTGSSLTIEVHYEARAPVTGALACFGVATVDSFYVSGFTNELEGQPLRLDGSGSFACTIVSLPLLTGVYGIHLKLRNRWGSLLGYGFNLTTFSVTVPDNIRRSDDYGIIQLNVEWPRSHDA